MIDVGFWEMAFIGVIALVIIGPERMPGVVRTTGTWFAKARRMVNDVKRDFKSEMDQADIQSVKDLQKDIRSTAEDFRRAADDAGVKEAAGQVNRTMDEMKKDLEEVETLNTPSDSPGGGRKAGQPDVKQPGKKTAKKKAVSRKKKTVRKKAPGKKKATGQPTGTGRKKTTSRRSAASKKVTAKRTSATPKKTRTSKLTKKPAAGNASRAAGPKQGLSGDTGSGA